MIWPASCAGELPVAAKPVAFGLVPGVTTVTMTAARPATTASAAAATIRMTLRRFGGRACRDGPDRPGSPDPASPTAGN